MAISPNHLNEKFMEEVDYYEKYFDKQLAGKKVQPGGYTTIDNIPSGYTTAHHQILKERYIESGWKSMEYNSEQREGTWITLK